MHVIHASTREEGLSTSAAIVYDFFFNFKRSRRHGSTVRHLASRMQAARLNPSEIPLLPCPVPAGAKMSVTLHAPKAPVYIFQRFGTNKKWRVAFYKASFIPICNLNNVSKWLGGVHLNCNPRFINSRLGGVWHVFLRVVAMPRSFRNA